jgi:hypothetical protein
MKRSSSKRTTVSMRGEFSSNGKTYSGHIGNVSRNGIFFHIASTKTAVDFIPGTKSEVTLLLPSGKKIRLQGEIKWLHTYKTQFNGLVNSLGMEIIDIPQEYTKLIKTLR